MSRWKKQGVPEVEDVKDAVASPQLAAPARELTVEELEAIADVSAVEELDAAEIERREREKASLVSAGRDRIAEERGPDARPLGRGDDSVAEELELPTVKVHETPELAAANAAIAGIDAELAKLDEEIKQSEELSVVVQRKAEENIKASRATLQRRRDEATYRQSQARLVANRVELAARAIQADEIVSLNRSRQQASQGEQTAMLKARLSPLLDAAKVNLSWLKAFMRQHEGYLGTFASKDWKAADERWEPKLRVEIAEKVYYASELFLQELRRFIGNELEGYTGIVLGAEKLLKRGWQAGREFELAEIETWRLLTIVAEPGVVAHVEQTLNRILASLKWCEEKGRAFTEESGGKIPEVVILLSPEARHQRAVAQAESGQQEYAAGTPGHEGGASAIIPGRE